MANVKLVVSYDGRNYLGWQKTKCSPTIEGTLQILLEQIYQEPISLQAASRTDAGVHANGQVVNFISSKEKDLNRLQSSLNQLLPKDISILSVESMPPSFHPTINSQGKEYHYYVCYGPVQMPLHRFYSWHISYPLDIPSMREAATFLTGTQDFSTFCNFKKIVSYSDFTRTIQQIEIETIPPSRLRFRIIGNHFLYKMVRNIVGTLIYVGRGRLQLDDIQQIIDSHDRTQAGITAPAHGLFLHQVFYGSSE
jgi:tRNA pseudouridine38-40 synthase